MSGQSVLIAAGGTGGHVFPGVALAKQLQSDGFEVHWVGTNAGLESRIVPAQGIVFHALAMQGFRGKQWHRRLMAIIDLLRSWLKLIGMMRALKIRCVVGMGGFASAPAGFAAKTCRVPLLLQEQNAVMGTTNSVLSRMAKKIFTGFPYSPASNKMVYSGNPLRADILAASANASTDQANQSECNILILGGSLGASVLNELLPQVLAELAQQVKPLTIRVHHQTGVNDIDAVRSAYAALACEVEAVAFIDDMVSAYQRADVVVARAGALTISELACFGLNAVLVPYPHAIDNHQEINARWLSDKGLARLIVQRDLNKQSLFDALCVEVRDVQGRAERSRELKAIARRDAVTLIAAEVKRCVNGE